MTTASGSARVRGTGVRPWSTREEPRPACGAGVRDGGLGVVAVQQLIPHISGNRTAVARHKMWEMDPVHLPHVVVVSPQGLEP